MPKKEGAMYVAVGAWTPKGRGRSRCECSSECSWATSKAKDMPTGKEGAMYVVSAAAGAWRTASKAKDTLKGRGRYRSYAQQWSTTIKVNAEDMRRGEGRFTS